MFYNDPRIEKVARNLLSYSVDLKPGESVMIDAPLDAKPLVVNLIRIANEMGGRPHFKINDGELSRVLVENQDEKALQQEIDWSMRVCDDIEAQIYIDFVKNDSEFSGVSDEKMSLKRKTRKPLSDRVVKTKKWALLGWPTAASAQKAGMSEEAFMDFILNVSGFDYQKMSDAMKPLEELINEGNKIQIKGPKTDITFSIEGMGAVQCSGHRNIPDGEVYTAPVKNSINGVINFNVASEYNGKVYNDITLEYKDGKLIHYSCAGDKTGLDSIFSTDEGAKFVGEFSFGVNPYITRPFCNTLFDEKITGSFHFTPGQAYEGVADNGNDSAIHWDLVCIQTPEFGGGEIYLDDRLIRKDGIFVIPELAGLNPDKLK